MTAVRKSLLLALSFVLVFGLMPFPAFADDEAVTTSDGENALIDGVTVSPEGQVENGDNSGLFVDDAEADLSSISFVYIESPSVVIDSVQNIVVGFADEGLLIESAELDVVGSDSQTITLIQDSVAEGAVLFSGVADKFPLGLCGIVELRYRVIGEDVTYVVDFTKDDKVDYGFEVVEAIESSFDDIPVATEAYTISEDGEYIGVSSIGDAMAAAGVDPQSGPNSQTSESDFQLLSVQANDGFVIVLDPGHGGSDSGANGYGLQEKDINIKIAQYCKAKLEQTPGVTVYMTRTNDTYVSLSDRTAFAVNHGADLVVSIHNNAGGGRGSEVIVPRNGSWYYEETYVAGTELGSRILGKLNALGLGTHSGVYSRDNTVGATYPDGSLSDYYSLIDGPRDNGILGIIVEHAFIDNASDVAWLNNDANLKRLGEADAAAIIEYYDTANGTDHVYWGVYNYDYYVSHNADAKSAANGSKIKALSYFKQTGMSKGQRANVLFDVNYYKANYSDLQSAFGNDLKKYYEHFIDYGMKEGRQGSADFNPAYYKAAYADVRNAYGNDWRAYYNHYVNYGMKEGRSATGSVSPSSSSSASRPLYRLYKPESGEHHYTLSSHERDVCVSQWGWNDEGVAWYCPTSSSTPVYRLYNPSSGLHHYTTSAYERNYCIANWGWNDEGIGWYAVDSGNPVYRLYHPESGHHHYTLSSHERDVCVSQWGWRDEGVAWFSPFADGGTGASSPVAADDEAIMGASRTTVAQMVRRYNAVGKAYPSTVYSKYGASNITQFCQVLYDEAVAEGVRPEVVFAQTMHETGWLQYGGDVKADQCNFAGIGATGGGNPGNSFNDWGANSVRKGLRAQVQHLKAYASTSSCVNAIVDPRFSYVSRGCAPTVKALGGKWASSASYGEALVSQVRALLNS